MRMLQHRFREGGKSGQSRSVNIIIAFQVDTREGSFVEK
jgi:hypothetical protein